MLSKRRMRWLLYDLRAMIIILSISPLVACSNFELFTVGVGAATQGFFDETHVNIKEKNYAAADYIIQQSGNYLGKFGTIQAKALSESDSPGITSPLGKKIAEDVGMRFSQLGYTVNLYEVTSNVEKQLYKPSTATPAYFITGSYQRNKRDIDVHLRLFSASNDRVISAFDYKLPLSNDLKTLSQTQTKIYRVEKSSGK